MKKLFLLLIGIVLFVACTSENEEENPNSDVDVPTAGKDVDQLLKDAIQSLENEQWDEAVAYYNAAYEKDNNDPRAIIYSTLANLAKISTDPKVATLIKDNFGFTEYPNKLNALFSDSWMKETPSVEKKYYDPNLKLNVEWFYKGQKVRIRHYFTDDEDTVLVNAAGYYYAEGKELKLASPEPRLSYERLPDIKTPSWVKGNGSLYDSYLLKSAFSVENWYVSIMANVLDKNSNGFNNTLDEVIEGVFGTSYNEAVNRLKKLENRKDEKITLDPYFIEKLELEEIFDEYDKIGWAEVNAVLSAMLAIKASLEWVQTYDLNTDLNWLKYAWEVTPDVADQSLINHFKSLSASQVPFNNNFLKPRSDKSMATPKATYTAAIKGLQASYTSIQNSDLYPTEVKDPYTAINDGFNKLIVAINDGGKFYIPEEIPGKGETWPATSSKAKATIDFGKIFTPGYLSLQNIFETDADRPVFYSESEECDEDYYWDCYYVYVKLSKSNYKKELSEGRLSLRVNVNHITAIVDQIPTDEFEYVDLGLDGELAEAIFEKYYP